MTLTSLLETILFAHGEPITLEKLAKITKEKKSAVLFALKELREEYKERGLAIISHENAWQMTTHPQNANVVEEVIKSDMTGELSRAALETVTAIAYKGPLTRSEIEYIRGVDSSVTLRTLLMRGLVERQENPKDARGYVYRVSIPFLRHLGISQIEDLPRYKEFRGEKIELSETIKEQ